MTGHFTLDVDPSLLRKAARHLDDIRTAVAKRATRVGATPADIAGRWTGTAAASVTAEMTGLAGDLTTLGPLLESAGTTLSLLATAYDKALEQMGQLNTQWDALDTAYDAAVSDAGKAYQKRYDDLTGSDGTPPNDTQTQDLDRVMQHAVSGAAGTRTAGQSQLQATWDTTVQHLRTHTTNVGITLVGAMPVTAPPGYGAIPGVGFDASTLLTNLQLTSASLALPAGPLDQQKVDDVLATLRKALGSPLTLLGVLLPLDDMLKQGLSGLTPAELDAVVAGMDDDELGTLDELVSLGALDRNTLSSLLGAHISATQLERLYEHCPSLEPALIGDTKDARWTYPGAKPGDPDIEDINQGGVGDCWFLASLAAEMRADPGFVGKHMVVNPNGTYTFTFYRDGKPVPITVDGRLPTQNDGSSLPYVHGDPNWGSRGDAWVALYEKAFAQLNGGYHNIEGGYGDIGLDALSGGDHDRLDPDDVGIDDIRRALDEHRPVTAGTREHSTGMLWWKHEDERVTIDDQTVISLHEYTVVDVDESTGKVKLRNPWGSNSSATEFVWLTMDELRDHFSEVSM